MKQQYVVITGAGSGLGQALALRFARTGACLALVDNNLERAQNTLTQLPGAHHVVLHADVSDDVSMQDMANSVLNSWPRVDVLINNAGIASGGNVLEAPMPEWRLLWETNFLSVVRGTRLFLPRMLEQKTGHIINTASFAGLAGAPGMMSYGVTKAAVVAFSEQLRAEAHTAGIAVSVICPAFFKTNLMQSAVGSEKIKWLGQKLMERSPDSLDDVADRIMRAIQQKRFLILPTRREPMHWRIKRFLPQLYFKLLLKRSWELGLRST